MPPPVHCSELEQRNAAGGCTHAAVTTRAQTAVHTVMLRATIPRPSRLWERRRNEPQHGSPTVGMIIWASMVAGPRIEAAWTAKYELLCPLTAGGMAGVGLLRAHRLEQGGEHAGVQRVRPAARARPPVGDTILGGG